jgi:methylmalonyl-CoA mutase, N-terminal domain
MENLYKPFDFDYNKDLGDSGMPPFTRGIYSDMYSGKEFTMRQLAGFGSPKDTNKRMKFLLDNGSTGLSVLFDFPTIQMYDSDSKLSEGHVGFSGVCVDSIEDMYELFEGIDITKHSISIVTHYPSNTAILFSMFLAMAQEKGILWSKLRGSVQNDIIMEEVVRCGSEFISPNDCFRIQCDNYEFIRGSLPLWNPVTLNGYNLRECGTSPITEMAVAILNGLNTIAEMVHRGYHPEFAAEKIAFFWSIGNDFFEEVARLRASRRLWYKLLKEKFVITNSKSLMMKCHVQTSGVSLTRQEPLNNIVRSSFQALSAVFGGVQSLHVDSYDEAYSVPTEQAALLSLRTQQIIQNEIGITKVVDPLGGSYYIESLTNQIEKEILEEINRIEGLGGLIHFIDASILHKEISEYSYSHQRKIESGEIPIVGLNKYTSCEKQNISTFEYPEGVEKEQIDKLKTLRKTRNNEKVKMALDNLSEICMSEKNIFPACIECALARCTEEEMFRVFLKSFKGWTK